MLIISVSHASHHLHLSPTHTYTFLRSLSRSFWLALSRVLAVGLALSSSGSLSLPLVLAHTPFILLYSRARGKRLFGGLECRVFFLG